MQVLPKLSLNGWMPCAERAMRLSLLAACALLPLVNAGATVVINEIMASNGAYYPDEDGDFEDWVELYNTGEEPVSLNGFGLSDDPDELFRWVLPDVTLEPGEYLVIFASGKDRRTPPNLHTNFNIASAGEALQLTQPNRVPMDTVAPVTLPRDVSYGRQPDGGEDFYYFDTPSAAAPNNHTAYQGITEPPEFSQAGGFFNASFELAITAPNDEAQVYYTLDGSVPDPALLEEEAEEISYGENLVVNSSFEEPAADVVPWPGYFDHEEPPVEIPGWRFTGSHGLNNNLSGGNETDQRNPFHGESRPIPDGGQVLFQQGTEHKTAAQTIEGLEDGKIYEVVFHVGTRPGNPGMDMWVTLGDIELHSKNRYNVPGAYQRIAYFVRYDSEAIGVPDLVFHSEYPADADVTILYDHVQMREVLSGVEMPEDEMIMPSEPAVQESYAYKNSYPENVGTPFGPLLYRPYEVFAYEEPIPIEDRSEAPNELSAINAHWRTQPQLPNGPVFKGTAVRANAVQPGYLPSETITHTYFVHPEIETQFTQDMVSIVTDEANLFGYEEGIYVAGKRFDDWRRENMDTQNGWSTHGNYFGRGREWERPAHVELFGQGNGARLFSQNIGLRIHGGSSRLRTPKSLRFYARNAYDDIDVMAFPFFKDAATKHDGTPLEEFVRVNLRTGGHIQNHLRDVPAHQLMEATEVDMMRARPVAHFFNGEFMGLSHVRDRFDRYHLEHNYGVDPDNVVILTGPNTPVNAGRLDEGREEDLALWNDMWDFVTQNDMQDPQNYAQFEQMMDIDSYIDLQIVFIYLNNWDWMGHKHFRMWRVRETSDAPYQDGRWRAHAWDFDASPRAHIPGNVFADFDFDLMINAIHPTGGGNGWTHGSAEATLFLRTLLENETFYNRFLNRFADHINTSFHPDRVKSVVQEEYDKIAGDNHHFRNSFHRDAAPEDTYNDWMQFADLRPGYVRDQIQTHFELPGQAQVQLDVSDDDHGHVRMNTVDIHPDTPGVPEAGYPWSGVYFQGVPIEIEAVPAPGYFFSHWEGLPEDTPAQATVEVNGDLNLTAHFVEAPPRHLLHYWRFNEPNAPIEPSYTQGAGHLEVQPGSETDVVFDRGQDFFGENARLEDDAGRHLRVNDPIGATVEMALPTTGHSHIVLEYETRRSGQGAGIQHVEYSVDGETFTPFAEFAIRDAEPVVQRLDFSDIEGVVDNPDFAVRLTFEAGNGGVAGNNRFDNITVEGYSMEDVDSPPVLTLEDGLFRLHESAEPFQLPLASILEAQVGGSPEYQIDIESETHLVTEILEDTLNFYPQKRGDTWMRITLDDGQHPLTILRARVLIYPGPVPLRERGFVFNAWDPEAPEGTFPRHMLFLQHWESDSEVDSALLHPYSIPQEEYHNDDWNSVGQPYNNTRRTRLNGLGRDGISFINTGRERDLGAALLAMDTRGLTEIPVQYLAGTVLPNDRVYALRLQYRVGMHGPFEDVLDEFGNPVEYVRTEVEGDEQTFGPLLLPEAAEDQPYVQLLWRYYHVAVADGPRAELRLDDIQVGEVRHSADREGDGEIGLSDLLRVVQLYNAGEYHCAPATLEDGDSDGYAPGLGDHECPPHSSDYAPQDWRITLPEVLRVVQLYNASGYVLCDSLGLESEDGFCLQE